VDKKRIENWVSFARVLFEDQRRKEITRDRIRTVLLNAKRLDHFLC
jgi:hypothetical protein